MNLLDRAIGWVNPERGLARARARAATGRIVRAYEAGKQAPLGIDWEVSTQGPNREIAGPVRKRLQARSREVSRDQSYGTRAVDIRVAHEIGFGIQPRPNGTSKDRNRRALDLWNRWAKRADLKGILDVYGIQAQAARARVEAGECLIRLVSLSADDMRARGLPVPLQLDVLETDWLADGSVGTIDPSLTTRAVEGILLDGNGAPVGYRILNRHPGDNLALLPAGNGFKTLPASEIIHLRRAHAMRPGTIRGVPDAASVLLRLRRLGEFETAAVEAAKVQALLASFVITANPMEVDTGNGAPDPVERSPLTDLYPGMIANLPVGSDVKFLAPSGPGPFAEYAMHELMAIASGYRVTYDQLTGDLRQANYSSLRAGKIEFRRSVEQDQWLMHIPQMCDPIWRAFVGAAILAGALDGTADDYPVTWVPPRWEMVDPNKETSAAVQAIRNGIETWQQTVIANGYDPTDQADELQEQNALFDERGLILDCDPRRMSNAGGANDPAQNAAVELRSKGEDAPAAADPADNPDNGNPDE